MEQAPERMFPVLMYDTARVRVLNQKVIHVPTSVPWAVVVPHEQQARKNHDQSLLRLAERGGLSPCELVAVLRDRAWQMMEPDVAVKELLELVSAGTGPRCTDCGHYTPDARECRRDEARTVRTPKGQRSVFPLVQDDWSCDSFQLYTGPRDP